MNSQTSFRKILEEKLRTSPSTAPPSGASLINTDPVHLAFLMTQVGRFSFQGTRKSIYPKPAPRPRIPHKMTSSEQQAFLFLKNWVKDLSEGFTMHELRRAFRQAALRLHPDQGGRNEDFLVLKAHYEVLKGLLTPVSP